MRNPDEALERACGVLSGASLFVIMGLTFFDVLGRKFLSRSVPGSLELTELLMVVVIFTALPMVSRKGEHVEFDSLDPYLPKLVRQLQHALVHAISGAMLIGLAWLMWRAGRDFAAAGETSVQLKIPKAPFIYAISILCAATGLVHFILLGSPVEKSSTPRE